jgi:hypothetical protein
VCLDGFMNIALEQTEEFVDGVLTHKYGDCFIRGNNGEPLFLSFFRDARGFNVCNSSHQRAMRLRNGVQHNASCCERKQAINSRAAPPPTAAAVAAA